MKHVRRRKKLATRKCIECSSRFKPLNVRHAYCSHRCKNRSGARRRHEQERRLRKRIARAKLATHRNRGILV